MRALLLILGMFVLLLSSCHIGKSVPAMLMEPEGYARTIVCAEGVSPNDEAIWVCLPDNRATW